MIAIKCQEGLQERDLLRRQSKQEFIISNVINQSMRPSWIMEEEKLWKAKHRASFLDLSLVKNLFAENNKDQK